MAALSANEMLEVVWAQGDGAAGAPSSPKTHQVFLSGSVEELSGPAGGSMTTSVCCPRYIIRGRLVAEGGTAADPGLVGFTVQLWESGASWELPRASVVSGDNGVFAVELDDMAFATATRTLTFKVFDPGGAPLTDPTETWTPAALDQQLLIHVIGTASVRTHVGGFVRTRDGTLVSGRTVRALAIEMRSEDIVGSGTTNADGRYDIDCITTATKFDLVIVAGTSVGGFTEQARSAITRDAGPVLEVDLVIGNEALFGRSEFQTLMEAIDSARGTVAVVDLTIDDVAIIADKYTLPPALVQLTVDSAKAVNLAGAASGLLSELFYALGRSRQSITLSGAIALSPADRQGNVDAAIASNQVPNAFEEVADAQLDLLASLVPGFVLTDAASGLETRLSVILRIAGMSNATDRQTLLSTYQTYEGTAAAFWNDAPALTGLTATLLEDARAALGLGIYVLNHPPMVQSLWDSSIRDPAELAKLSASDWTDRIDSDVTLPGGSSAPVDTPIEIIGANSTEKVANYAAALVHVSMRAFPSNAFVASYRVNPIGNTAPLAMFFSANPSFDFASMSIFQYARDNASAFTDNEAAKPLVEKLARLFKVVPEKDRYANAQTLWNAGYGSARSIYLTGKQAFIAKMTTSYAWSAELALGVYVKASQINGLTEAIAMQYGKVFQGFGQGGALALQGQASPPSSIPDWETLFGELDYCACEQCASVLSPAAYLTDLIHFVDKLPGTKHFEPPDLSGCEHWLRADKGVTFASGKVSEWADQSGTNDTNRNAIQSTSANQPAFTAEDSAYNGQPTLSFSGSHWLDTNPWSPATAGTFFVVGHFGNNGATEVMVCFKTDAGGIGQLYINGTNDVRYYQGTDLQFPAAVTPGSPHIYAVERNGASTKAYQEGTNALLTGDAGAAALGRVSIGANTSSGGSPLGGGGPAKMAEIISYNRILSAGERAKVMRYLAARYGFAVDLPVRDLRSRRPDITKIELSCENTNTVLPYIDLTNERLELMVASHAEPGYQTSKAEDELATHPEHLRTEAYDALLGKVYPWSLPYNLWVDESRSYIGLKGVTRAEIRAALLADPISDAEWAQEVLELTLLQRQLVQGSGSGYTMPAPSDFWGLGLGFVEDSFNLATWTATNAFISAIGLQDPDGTSKATRLYDTTANQQHRISGKLEHFGPGSWSVSVYAKMSGVRYLWIQIGDTGDYCYFDLQNGTVGNAGPNATGSISSAANGFYKCTITCAPSSGSTVYFGMSTANGSATYSGTGSQGIILYKPALTNWYYPLRFLPVFLTKSGLSYDEAVELFGTSFVASVQSTAIQLPSCSVDDGVLDPVDASSGPVFDRIHRFERLRRTLGWSRRQVDRAITNLGAGTLDPNLIAPLAYTKEVIRRTKVRVEDVLTWREGAVIDTTVDPKTGLSPYDKLFPKRNVSPSGEEPFALNADRTALAVETNPIASYRVELATALRTDVASLDAIVSYESLTLLTLGSISTLFRYASLAKTLKLKVPSLLVLLRLTSKTPFSASTPDHALRLLDDGAVATAFKLSPEEVRWILWNVDTTPPSFRPANDVVETFLRALRDGLVAIPIVAIDVSGDVTKTYFTRIFSDEAVALESYEIVAGTSAQDPTDQETFIGNHFGAFANTSDAADKLVTGSGLLVGNEERFGYMQPIVQLYVDRQTLVIDRVASAFKITNATADALLRTHLHARTAIGSVDSATIALAGLTSLSAVEGDVTIATVPAQALGYVHLEKVTRIVVKLKLEDADIAWVFGHGPLDLDALPSELVPTLVEGCLFWARSDAGVSVTTGRVTAWADQSGAGDANRNLVQATSSRQPTFIASDPLLGGHPSIQTTYGAGTGEGLQSLTWAGSPRTTPMTFFYVGYRNRTALGNDYFFDSTDPSHQVALYDFIGNYLYDFTNEGSNCSTHAEPANLTAFAAVAVFDTVSKIYVSENAPTSTSNQSAGPYPFSGLSVGNWAGIGPQYAGTSTAEIAVWNRLLTAEEIAQLNAYAHVRYGIPIAGMTLPGFAEYRRLVEAAQLRDHFRNKELFDIFEAAATWPGGNATEARADVLALLAERGAWRADDLTALADVSPALVYPGDFDDELGAARLVKAMLVVSRLELSATVVEPWKIVAATSLEGATIKKAIRGTFEPERWRPIAEPLRDALRERQRDAMVDYLVRSRNAWFADANALSEYLLCDVLQMSCAKTSRIKQAIGSVQTYVQRVLLDLEPDVSLTTNDGIEWKWMKNYRVWEANRKIFLYPENWIEPALRDDKTPLFRDFETALSQGELKDETIEDAVFAYLQGLDGIAMLEPCASVTEIHDAVNRFHVVARTRHEPHGYFYRRREDGRTWTPWTKIDADIQSDHVMLALFNRRLYLFSPVITDVPVEENPPQSPPRKRFEVRLRWMTYRNGKWSKLEKSKSTLPVAWEEVYEDPTIAQKAPLPLPQPPSFALSPAERVERNHDKLSITHRLTEGDNLEVHVIDTRRTSQSKDHPWFWRRWYQLFTVDGARGTVRADGDNDEIRIVTPLTPPRLYARAQWRTQNPESGAGLSLFDVFWYYNWEIESGKVDPVDVLLKSPTPYDLLTTAGDDLRTWISDPVFYTDRRRCFFIAPAIKEPDPLTLLSPYHTITAPAPDSNKQAISIWSNSGNEVSSVLSLGAEESGGSYNKGLISNSTALLPPRQLTAFVFTPFYHPYVGDVMVELNRVGLDGMFAPKPGSLGEDLRFQAKFEEPFETEYEPTLWVAKPHPIEDFDFTVGGAYSQYNWELFFHVPMLIATKLAADQKFEDAKRWFEYIFDPTAGSAPGPVEPAPQRYWKVKPFHALSAAETDAQGPIKLLELLLDHDDTNPARLAARKALETAVQDWRLHPFEPYRVARLRPVAFMKNVVMKYLDMLIAWADQLFSRETIESINEATQLYVIALRILGKKPTKLPPIEVAPASYDELSATLDAFSNALVAIETVLPPLGDGFSIAEADDQQADARGMYFCVIPNDRLMEYWSTVEDRLFKIRNCLSIEGVELNLPLFEPPIDPGLLVQAVAAGIDIGSVLQDVSSPPPRQRYAVLSQRANELASEVKSLGQSLLSTLEKRDAEELALLRSNHEIQSLAAIRAVKEQALFEAKASLEALKNSLEGANIRSRYFGSRVFKNSDESTQTDSIGLGAGLRVAQQVTQGVAATLEFIPETQVGNLGAGPNPHFLFGYGGAKISRIFSLGASVLGSGATIVETYGQLAGLQGGYQRRKDEWDHQKALADNDVLQIGNQIAAATARADMAQRDLDVHDLQFDNAITVRDFMRDKYTNFQLYDWMVGQISAVYFQMYSLAYQAGKRAERAWQFELAETPKVPFITFGYWDGLHRGLLAGERLSLDLKRMEMAYLDKNAREYELTKDIPLTLLDPEALQELRESGSCIVAIPETHFDADTPGHYRRRIKHVALTIAGKTGPYTHVRCTLTLLSSEIRMKPNLDSDSLVASNVALQSIVTSTGNQDSGLFELNLRDERYLPFEGAGAVSVWKLDLPTSTSGAPANIPSFDYRTIEDVVFHMRYMAKEGGKTLRDLVGVADGALDTEQWKIGFSCKVAFSDEWRRFRAGTAGLILALTKPRLPFRAATAKIQGIELVRIRPGTTSAGPDLTGLTIDPAATPANPFDLEAGGPELGYQLLASLTYTDQELTTFTITSPNPATDFGEDDDLVVIVSYKVSSGA